MKKMLAAVSMFAALCATVPAFATNYADIAFVVDQSGSMGDEFAWIGSSISTISTGVTNAGITAKYGIAGYEYTAGSASSYNAWADLTNDISTIVNEANSVSLYGGTERGYHALDWAANNFSWTGGSYAKVVILVTDEPNDYRSSYSYGGLTGEAALEKMVNENNILLNVVTFTNYYQYWDDAAFTKDSYQGLFDLSYLTGS